MTSLFRRYKSPLHVPPSASELDSGSACMKDKEIKNKKTEIDRKSTREWQNVKLKEYKIRNVLCMEKKISGLAIV